MTAINGVTTTQPERRTRVLIVAQEKGVAANLAATLVGNGFDCEIARREHAPQYILDIAPGIVLLDVAVVDAGSLALCENIRGLFRVPVVICSMRNRESDIVRALEAGADDYIVLPMSSAELGARLHAILRRTGDYGRDPQTAKEILIGDLTLSMQERRAYRRGQPIDLSPIEFRLLLTLIQESGRPVSHSKLLRSVWGPEYVDSRHYLRLYVRYLRSKLEDNPQDPRMIVNEWGVGYRFEAKSA